MDCFGNAKSTTKRHHYPSFTRYWSSWGFTYRKALHSGLGSQDRILSTAEVAYDSPLYVQTKFMETLKFSWLTRHPESISNPLTCHKSYSRSRVGMITDKWKELGRPITMFLGVHCGACRNSTIYWLYALKTFHSNPHIRPSKATSINFYPCYPKLYM